MRRCAITVVGLALLAGMPAPVQALPILETQGLDNLELAGGRYILDLPANRGGKQTDAKKPFETSALSIVGTTGVGGLSADPGIEYSLDVSALIEASNDESDVAPSEVTSLSGDRWSCGQPGRWFSCYELLGVSARVGTTVDVTSLADQQQSSEQSDAQTDRVARNVKARPNLMAATPIVFLLLTSGVAAAGFAGWRTLKKGRRSKRGRRRSRRHG